MLKIAAPKVPPARVVHVLDVVRSGVSALHRRMVPPPVALLEMINQCWATQAIYAAAKLDIAGALADGPLTATEIADKVGADPDGVQRLLRLLVSKGIFARDSSGRYRLNALADALRSDADASMRGFALFVGSPEHWEHWAHLTDSVRTGDPSVREIRGMPFFEFLSHKPEFGAIFDEAMTSLSELSTVPICAAYDFTRFDTIVDVGGGRGRLLAAILQQTPQSRGILFDQPHVVEAAAEVLAEQGVAQRCAVESGSFFERVPSGGDAYLLKHIIHDWPHDEALAILRTVRAAMPTGATLLLIEFVLPEGDEPHFGKLVDLEMLLSLGGRERTAQEFRDFLAEAGFELARIVPTAGPICVIEAKPA
ncbi:hydroxyneurosporene methyltransferase [Skermania sp. ID1734]|uniref:methyltransferase n=1 Tax=Skermania sp. ID1734 TaxID=2597516 RepID=UPI0011802320|nr:methyltransferase [Skermania sp. ID1734]TSE01115.1 hydroxyneurosporene methyltransferase [Skermania sp. ID1734]